MLQNPESSEFDLNQTGIMVESSLNQGFGSPQAEEKWREKQPTNEGGRVSSVCVGASAHMERARQAPKVVV